MYDGTAGEQSGPVLLFVDLDDVVPPDHLVRQIDGLLDLGWVQYDRQRQWKSDAKTWSEAASSVVRHPTLAYQIALQRRAKTCALRLDYGLTIPASSSFSSLGVHLCFEIGDSIANLGPIRLIRVLERVFRRKGPRHQLHYSWIIEFD